MKIAIACGGTGGHVFPGVATAEALCSRGCDVTILGTGRDVESESLKGWGGAIESTGLAGYSKSGAAGKLLLLCSSVFVSLKILKRIKPAALLAMGGYASFGPVAAGWLLSIPVVLHEGNAVPGRALRLLSLFAKCIAVNFEKTTGLPGNRIVKVTGFPVRRALLDAAMVRNKRKDPGEFCVLVLGGSQGAQVLNEIVPEAVKKHAAEGCRIRILHIAGEPGMAGVRDRYAGSEAEVEVYGFVRDMAGIYSRADAAISRSGASVLAELAVFGIPALLIPYPYASDDHQRANALHYAISGGVEVVDQPDFNPERCRAFIDMLAGSPGTCSHMRDAMLACARISAASELADIVKNSGKEQINADI